MLSKNNKFYNLNLLVYTHMWEFFSTFGMTALLTIYITNYLLLSDEISYMIFGSYMGLLYSSPLFASAIIKNRITDEACVFIGGILMVLGHCIIIVQNIDYVYLSLGLMISGYGLFTPSLIKLTKEVNLKDVSNDTKFTYYYVGQNIGSLLAPIVCSYIGIHFGWKYGFLAAGLGMISGLYIFTFYNRLKTRHTNKSNKAGIFHLSFYVLLTTYISYTCLYYNLYSIYSVICILICVSIIGYVIKQADSNARKKYLYICTMMVFMILFFTMLSQSGSTLILFFDRLINRDVFGYTIPTPVLLSIESLSMIIFSPLFIAHKMKYKICRFQLWSQNIKYMYGLLLMAIAFMVFYKAALVPVMQAHKASLMYVGLGLMLFSLAELLIMPIGFSIVTEYSEYNKLHIMIALWMLGQSLARFISGFISGFASIPSGINNISIFGNIYAHVFLGYATSLLVGFIVLLVFKSKLDKMRSIC